MPVLNTSNMSHSPIHGTQYSFSSTRIKDLGATEYTLVGIATDASGSVASFRSEIEDCVRAVVAACRRSARADNLMLRFTTFDSRVYEIHGFKPLSICNADDYKGVLQTGGTTALIDAGVNMTESVVRYGQQLIAQNLEANGILFVITDGMENASSLSVGALRQAMERAVSEESVESLVSVLIGVNTDATTGLNTYLKDLKDRAGFSQYISIDRADAGSLASLARFVQGSIAAQSRVLGSGGHSQLLTF